MEGGEKKFYKNGTFWMFRTFRAFSSIFDRFRVFFGRFIVDLGKYFC